MTEEIKEVETEQPTRTLIKKLAKVMTEVKYIEKKGYNNFSRYKYATESDVAEKVREVLADQNVIMMPDVVEHSTREHTSRKGNVEYIATVRVKFTFIDGDSGESLSIHSVGEGQDSGDKAVYKAITGAQKYALMKAFMIPTGDDPEADEPPANNQQTQQQPNNAPPKQPAKPTVLSPKQLGMITAKVKGLSEKVGMEQAEVYKLAQEKTGVSASARQLTPAQASKIIEYLITQEG